jgi:hypothetical protein
MPYFIHCSTSLVDVSLDVPVLGYLVFYNTKLEKELNMEAYIAAIISCFCCGVFYLIDMIMKDCTYNRASQPLAVSSAFALIPAVGIYCISKFFNIPSPTLLPCMIAFCSGTLLMVGSWIYFKIVFSDVGECTEISVFENSSVVMIALFTLIFHSLGFQVHDVIQPSQWLGIGIATIALVAVHQWGDKCQLVDWKHRIMLLVFMCFAALDEMTIDWALHMASEELSNHSERAAFLSISPFHWLGFSTGVLVLLSKKERKEFISDGKQFLAHWKLIVLAELIALVAFGAMVYGFATGHVAVIAIMSGSFPVVVFLGGILLRRKFGFSEELFPVVQHPWKKGIAILVVILGITLAAWG